VDEDANRAYHEAMNTNVVGVSSHLHQQEGASGANGTANKEQGGNK
jgi:hypothetical protein